MMSEGFIKLHRKMLDWEWYTDTNTKVLFLHCLFKANWKDGKWKGITVPRGSFITSRQKLAEELHMSEREVRTALTHLFSTNELTKSTSPKYTMITVVKYDEYQLSDQQKDQQATNKRPTNDQQTTTIEERKKRKKERIYISAPNKFNKVEQRVYDFDQINKKIMSEQ